MVTICLVTQGRKQVLEFLESAAAFADYDFFNFLVIDNAAPYEISKKIESWAKNQPRTTYIRRETNTTDFNEIWPHVQEFAGEWVNFPGDDDRLILHGYLALYEIVSNDVDLAAVGMSAKIIDEDGKFQGEIVSPNFILKDSRVEPFAFALNSPPFFWPSLFFRKSLIASPFPRSRFVLDWWISMQLLMQGRINTVGACSLEYRRHELQESNQTSLRRKMFEASFQFDDLLLLPTFQKWLESFSDEDLILLWNTSFSHRPIYGDFELGNLILLRLAKVLLKTISSRTLAAQIFSDISLAFGNLYHDRGLFEIVDSKMLSKELLGNLHIDESHFACPILQPLSAFFVGTGNALNTSIVCSHQKSVRGAVRIDCSSYGDLSISQQLDTLVQDVVKSLEVSGRIEMAITPRERQVVTLLREVKRLFNGRILMRIRRMVRA